MLSLIGPCFSSFSIVPKIDSKWDSDLSLIPSLFVFSIKSFIANPASSSGSADLSTASMFELLCLKL